MATFRSELEQYLQTEMSRAQSKITELEAELRDSRIKQEWHECTLDQALKTCKANKIVIKQQLETALAEMQHLSISFATIEQEKKSAEELLNMERAKHSMKSLCNGSSSSSSSRA